MIYEKTTGLNENWAKFKQQFNIFPTASGLVPILLDVIVEEPVDLVNSFNFLEENGANGIRQVLKLFEEYCNPKKNIYIQDSYFTIKNKTSMKVSIIL